MIIDSFKNCKKYYTLGENIEKAFEYILNNDLSKKKCGSYEIDGKDLYINIEEYTTKTVSKPEYHKKYIDIQFLIKGSEYVGYCPVEDTLKDGKFDAKKDVGFGIGVVDYIKLRPKQFIILFPNDAHQPCMADGKPAKVKKAVVKIRIN